MPEEQENTINTTADNDQSVPALAQQSIPKATPDIPQIKSFVTHDEVVDALIDGYSKRGNDEDKNIFATILSNYLKQCVEKNGCLEEYNTLVIFDNTTMVKSDSDRIYRGINSIAASDKNKKLLLILLSKGGEPGSAYLIGKLCRGSSNGKFVVVVPRYAKSAATLLSTAADEIHMGDLSELGPIDPQINGIPALGLKNSIEHIAELVQKIPGSSDMFAKYLSESIEPIQIGYYERVAKSAEQYAEKLLNSHRGTLGGDPGEIARKLVHDYKDHGFVIDKAEAVSIFGDDVIKVKTQEYVLGNDVYSILSSIKDWAEILGYSFYFIGSIDSKPVLKKG